MNKYHDKDDSTLVQMTLLGDQSAFEELVTRHERAVNGTAYHVTGCKFSAEDATQDAFVSAWMNLSALREREKFGIWVCSIAKNHARTLEEHYRSTVPNISLNEFENFDIPDTVDSDIFQYADLHEKVDALSEKIREAVKLHYFSDLSIKEIAKKICPEDRYLIFRYLRWFHIQKDVRQMVEEKGWYCDGETLTKAVDYYVYQGGWDPAKTYRNNLETAWKYAVDQKGQIVSYGDEEQIRRLHATDERLKEFFECGHQPGWKDFTGSGGKRSPLCDPAGANGL